MNYTNGPSPSTWQNPLDYVHKTIGNSLTNVVYFFKWLDSFTDPRAKDWPLMSRPGLVLAIFFLYLYIANNGSKWMEQKKPFKLRLPLIVYNLSLASLNAWLTYELVYCMYKLQWSTTCQLIRHTKNSYDLRIANVIWWYWASKGFEFADTFFFILRKKSNQLSFLHKYHHSSMFIIWWVAAKFTPGGTVAIPVSLNSFVHVLMYLYYGLSAIPSMQKFLWWKKHLTRIQLIQFALGGSIGTHMVLTGCPHPIWMTLLFGIYTAYALFYIILFGNFYKETYKSESNLVKNNHKDSSCKSEHENKMDGNSKSNGQDDNLDDDIDNIVRRRKSHQQAIQVDKSKQQYKLI